MGKEQRKLECIIKYKTMKQALFLMVFILTNLVMAQEKTIYDFTVETIDGQKISLSEFKGKKIMIVNTASKCGFTPQFEQLEAIYQQYKDKNFIILGFPTNDFLSQDPGSNEEIYAFCTKNYGVSFPMMAKITVKGKGMEPLYKYLTTGALNGYKDSKVSWNFQKFLIGTTGKLERIYEPKVVPNDPQIIEWIEN